MIDKVLSFLIYIIFPSFFYQIFCTLWGVLHISFPVRTKTERLALPSHGIDKTEFGRNLPTSWFSTAIEWLTTLSVNLHCSWVKFTRLCQDHGLVFMNENVKNDCIELAKIEEGTIQRLMKDQNLFSSELLNVNYGSQLHT